MPVVTAQPAPPAPTTAITAAPPAQPSRRHARGDSLEGFNRAMFSIHQVLDRIVFRPVAMAYKAVVPKVVRTGIRHFFSNAGEPIVFVNDLLQLQPKRAARTLARFGINSTVGVGGLLDVAKTRKINLPHHDNGFGDTLGRYGVGPGPYLFLPLVGPSDLRDFTAGLGQGAAVPLVVGNPFDRAEYQIPHAVLGGLDLRAENDEALRALLAGAVDPYATLRSAYLQDRAATIAGLRRGAAPAANPLDDPLTDPAAADLPAGPPPPGEAAPAP